LKGDSDSTFGAFFDCLANMDNYQALEKIKKLLALGRDKSSSHEATTARRMASDLMEKFNVYPYADSYETREQRKVREMAELKSVVTLKVGALFKKP
jgi:hypothetical protein